MIDVIIPSYKTELELSGLIASIRATAGCSHRIVTTCQPLSAAGNRNYGLDRAAFKDMVVMVDDDIQCWKYGWLKILFDAIMRPEVVMVSAQLFRPGGAKFAYMTGINDWGATPKWTGETVVRTKMLLTACCAIKPHGLRFDEEYVGSGFEDTDFCKQLERAAPDGIFLVCHDAHIIHLNEQKRQVENNDRNRVRYISKWGKI